MAQGLQYISNTNSTHSRTFQSLSIFSLQKIGGVPLYFVDYTVNRIFEPFHLVNSFCNAINLKLQRSTCILQASRGTRHNIWLGSKI